MASGTGSKHLHREFDIPGRITGNTVQFLVEGTGHWEIMNVGYSFDLRAVGDTNP
jgi:hypothetical protein